VTVTINALPGVPNAGNVIACFDGVVHTGSATAGPGESVVWYTAATGGSVTTAPTGSLVGTYTAYAAAQNDATGCESATRTLVTVTINALPGAPSAGNVIACFDGNVHNRQRHRGRWGERGLVRRGDRWQYDTAPSGTAVGTYTAYATAKIDATGCESGTRTLVTVTINALPGAPSAGNVIACFDGNVHTGSATAGAGESVVWYTAATGGSTTTAPSGTGVGTYTAYAAAKMMRPDARAAHAL
jgi:hypothetical protein